MPYRTFAAVCSLLLTLPLAAQPKEPALDARVQRITANVVDMPIAANEPPLRLDLRRVMQIYHVPGLSVAVIDNFKTVWTRGYGVIEPGSTAPVTPGTLFQAGSISKPVAAAGALRLVEQGKLALDDDVNLKLKTWKVPENEFTKTQKVTLRRLMSHTAGLTVHGFPGYAVNAPMPSLVQILNGEKPANTAAIRVDVVPGAKTRYSGGGVTIEQQLMIDVTGQPFPALLRDTVLDPLGMTDSSYEQPLPPARAAQTAGGAFADGRAVPGRWHLYPEMAAAGLWTTPADLAKFAIEIALSRHGKSNRVLSAKMTAEMLTPVLQENGLGFFVDQRNPGQFGHTGADEGFQALLTMNSESGQGIVIMANSDNGVIVADLLLRSIVKEYGWQYKAPDPGASGTLMLIARLKSADAALLKYTEFKASADASRKVDETTLNELGYRLLASGQVQDAIACFQRNVQEYPKSANAYDSLAEAHAKAGQSNLAIRNYELSLQLNPKNQTAVDAVRKLKGTK